MEQFFFYKNQMGILKTIDDNYSRQLLTIREYILFGLEECAGRIGNPQQNDCSKRRMRRMERMIKELV
jgi:hypothetical protein